MFTVQDLTVGDLDATHHITVTKVQALPAKLAGQTLFNVQGVDWDNGSHIDIVTVASKEIEVWE